LSERKVNIVGVGNTLMGDDGVGPAAIERLRNRDLGEGVVLWDAGLAVSDVLGLMDPADPLIVVDAVRAGGEPGTLYEAEIDVTAEDEAAAGAMFSLHEVSAMPALQLEAVTGRVFEDVTVIGVEPAVVQWGDGLSPTVAEALEKLVDAVLRAANESSRVPASGRSGVQAEPAERIKE
jgi:hydrogenase maturation protease